jgi:hypothetical protein
MMWSAKSSYNKGPDGQKKVHIGTFPTEVKAAEAVRKSWDEHAPDNARQRGFREKKPVKKPKIVAPSSSVVTAGTALVSSTAVAQPISPMQVETPPPSGFNNLFQNQEWAASYMPMPPHPVGFAMVPLQPQLQLTNGGDNDPGAGMPVALMDTAAVVEMVQEEAWDPNAMGEPTICLSGDYDLVVKVGQITIGVMREKLFEASVLFRPLLPKGTTGLVIDDMLAENVIAVMMPISFPNLRTQEFLGADQGDMVWQALMAACELEVNRSVEFFATLLRDEDELRQRQELHVKLRAGIAEVLGGFTGVRGVNECIALLGDIKVSWTS